MSAPEREGDLIGRRIGSYLIEGTLGRGSMASVYRARDVLTRTEVALKVHTRKENEASKRRFFQEARAIQRLKHPGLVEIYEVGIDGDLSFIAMELVRGASLSVVMHEGPLPWQEAVRLLHGIASALAHAHAQGVMHRDLKPSNVLVTHDGQVKLVDFGLAKRIGAVPDAGDGETVWDWSDVHTQPGAVLGTPAYMSPEQARAVDVDFRADIFSLGVILWEAIAGRALFRRATPAGTLRAILNDVAPPLGSVSTDVPAWLERLVARALEKQPENRHEDARAFLRELWVGPERGDLSVALSRLTERQSMVLAEPPFVGRARELRVAAQLFDAPERAAFFLGLPGSGRRRLARAALGELGLTRPLMTRAETPQVLERAYRERNHDSLVIDAGEGSFASALELGRKVVGDRVRIAVVGCRPDASGPESLEPIRVLGLSPHEGGALLASLSSRPETANEAARTGVLSQLSSALGGHAQSLVTVAARLMHEDAASLAAALELSPGWPEVLAPLGALRAWLAAEVALLGDAGLEVLSALSVVPSLTTTHADAIIPAPLAHGVAPGAAPDAEAGRAMLARLSRTPLLDRVVHAELVTMARWAVPPLVRRTLIEHGRAPARLRSEAVLLALLADRADQLAALAREHPEEEPVRELLAEREAILTLVARALEATGANLEPAARALTALVEADALEEPDETPIDPGADMSRRADHLLGRLLSRGMLSKALSLRVLVARLAARPAMLSGVAPHGVGFEDALALARELGDPVAEARLLLARSEASGDPTGDPSGDPSAGYRTSVDAALEKALPTVPIWARQEVLERVGEIMLALGEPDRARGGLRNALALAEEREDVRGRARLTHRLARIEVELGDLDVALREEQRALDLAISAGDGFLASLIECSLAELRLLGADHGDARTFLDRAASRGPLAVSRAALVGGHLELVESHHTRARALYTSALSSAERYRDQPGIAIAHAGLAAAFAAAGERGAASDALVRATLAARTLPEPIRLSVAGWRAHIDRAGADRDGTSNVETDAVIAQARARFSQAGIAARAASEAGTGARIALHVLIGKPPPPSTETRRQGRTTGPVR